MRLTSKDKSLILFIVTFIVIVWSSFSIFSFFEDMSKRTSKNIEKLLVASPEDWVNLDKPLLKSDLEDRIILIKFWHHTCITCIQNITKLKSLKEKFGNDLLIITIHSSKFNSEQNLDSIKEAIAKYNINLPVLADKNQKIYDTFDVKSLPYYILINPLGKIVKKYDSVSKAEDLTSDIKSLISKFRYRLNKEKINVRLLRDEIVKNVLSYPSRLAYTLEFNYENKIIPVIFIANIGDDSIIVSSLDGTILYKIGGRSSGFVDGKFENAAFENPQGMVFKDNKLFVADVGNNAIRVIDFSEQKVSTFIGNGKRGTKISSGDEIDAKDFSLYSPLDIIFFPDDSNLVIANSGANQILNYNFYSKKISLLAGSGEFGMIDGVGDKAVLAQTFDIESYDNLLYFIDSKSSSLRTLDENGNVKTLSGSGVDKFGHVNGDSEISLMQNPTSLTVDDTGIYVVDNLNNLIRRFNFESGQFSDYQAFINNQSELLKLNEPTSIVSFYDRFYIADSNNHRIISINRSDYKPSLLNILPSQKIPKEHFVEFSFNKNKVKKISVVVGKDVDVDIKLRDGWKINNLGPSYLNLLMIIDDENAKILKSFDWFDILNNNIKLPAMNQNSDYIFQGYIYYCEDKENALCYIKNYQRNIIAKPDNGNTKILIELGQ